MDSYNVIVSPKALSMLEDYVNYIQYTLFNDEAAKQVWEDAIETVERLSYIASVLHFCSNPVLHSKGYRSIKFKTHNYVMIYKIDQNDVFVEAIYHQLQNYESLFIDSFIE